MIRRACLAAVVVLSIGGAAQAASYASLVSQGYETGALTKNRAGIQGWTVRKGESAYFCRMAAGMAYVGRTGLVSITSSGRRIKIDRAVWEASRGGADPSLPQLSDLEAGRLRPQDVGACRAT